MEGAIDSIDATSRSVAEAHVRSHCPSVLCMGSAGCSASASSGPPSAWVWKAPSTSPLQQGSQRLSGQHPMMLPRVGNFSQEASKQEAAQQVQPQKV